MHDDPRAYHERARRDLARGDIFAAIDALVAALSLAHITEVDVAHSASLLADLLEQRGDLRGALTVQWLLGLSRGAGAARLHGLLARVPPVDRARSLAAMGDASGAARDMEAAGLVATAAMYRERSGEWQAARALWSRLTTMPSSGPDAYLSALAFYNVSRCAQRCNDTKQARDASIAAVRLLEEAADDFETRGLRERAFDAFQVLAHLGRESGVFEHVLEGYVNAIRILREDHLKLFALQHFDEAIHAAKERGESSAAATLAREAASYAREIGTGNSSVYYTLAEGELWRAAAVAHTARRARPELAENALLDAILAFGEVGQFARVGALYHELAGLELEPSKQTQYARAALRYADVADEPLDPAAVAKTSRDQEHFPDVWHVDLVEWEQKGSAAEACADILLDPLSSPLMRRRAMLARWVALSVEARPTDTSVTVSADRARLAEMLGELQHYAVLSPLETLFERPEQIVKVAVLRSLQQLYFKRTFVTVRAGLRHVDPAVVEQARKTTESLSFQHAFDPLARIVRESQEPAVRASAFAAIARIDTVEAAEFVLGMLEHGSPTDRTATLEALSRARGSRFIELARSAMPTMSAEGRAAVARVLRARGIPA